MEGNEGVPEQTLRITVPNTRYQMPAQGPTFQPSYSDQRRDYQDAQDQTDLHNSLSNVLFPAQVAGAFFNLAQEQLHLQGQTQALAQQTKDLANQNEFNSGFADQTDRLTNSGGADTTLPVGESAAAQHGRIAAVLQGQQAQANNALFTADHMARVNQANEDAAAMVHTGMTSDDWNSAPPAVKNQARFDIQFNPLRGKGLTDADISALPVNGASVGDLLADPNNFTPRGTLKPNVYGDVVTAASNASMVRQEKMKADTAEGIASAKRSTPEAIAHEAAAQNQKLTQDNLEAFKVYQKSLGPLGATIPVEQQMADFHNKFLPSLGVKPLPGSNEAPPAGSVTDQLTGGPSAPAPAKPAAPAGPKEVTSQADYDALPKGSTFTHGGKQFVKK